MDFDREYNIREMIIKQAIENTSSDTSYGKATRGYLWSIIAESIFAEDPIEFYSQRMRKTFAPPDFRKTMTVKPGMKKGKDAREIITIEGVQMVVPNTYEDDKWTTDNVAAEKAAKAKLVAQAKLDNSQVDLT